LGAAYRKLLTPIHTKYTLPEIGSEVQTIIRYLCVNLKMQTHKNADDVHMHITCSAHKCVFEYTCAGV